MSVAMLLCYTPHEMSGDLGSPIPGQWYMGFECRECAAFLAVYPSVSGASTKAYGTPTVTVPLACPHCGLTHHYFLADLQNRQIPPAP